MTESVHYCPNCGHELLTRQLLCPKCDTCCELFSPDVFKKKKKKTRSSSKSISASALAPMDARFIDANTQWRKYWAGSEGQTGHGFAAEDANAFWDRIHFRKVSLDGRNNALNGPDRIVDGVQIQTKYCQNASSSVNAAFKDGHFRYFDASGSPMTLEVPRDQYEEAVKLMEQKIRDGELGPTFTDPSQASSLVKRGKYTYKQAKNLARAGNIDSLRFDAQTGAVFALGAFTISFIIDIGLIAISNRNSGMAIEDLVYAALVSSLKSGGIVFATHIGTQQLLKTQFVRNRIVSVAENKARSVLNEIWSSEQGKKALARVAKTSIKDSRDTIAKRIGTGAGMTVVLFAVTETPIIFKYASGSISGRQASKDSIVNTMTILGGLISIPFGGWVAFPIAIAGSVFGRKIGVWVSDLLGEDDSKKMQKLVTLAEIKLAEDYLLYTREEMQYVQDSITYYNVIDVGFLESMYKAGDKGKDDIASYQLAYSRLAYYFEKALRRREPVEMTSILQHYESVVEVVNKYNG